MKEDRNDRHIRRGSPMNKDGWRKPEMLQNDKSVTNGDEHGDGIDDCDCASVSPNEQHQDNDAQKMSRIPLIHIKGKAVGSVIGMPKPADAPTGLKRKLMPSPMMAAGTRNVNQNSGSFHFNTELFDSVFMFIFPFLGSDGVGACWRYQDR